MRALAHDTLVFLKYAGGFTLYLVLLWWMLVSLGAFWGVVTENRPFFDYGPEWVGWIFAASFVVAWGSAGLRWLLEHMKRTDPLKPH